LFDFFRGLIQEGSAQMSFVKNASGASISLGGRLARKILAGAALAAVLPVLHVGSASAASVAIGDLYGDPTNGGSAGISPSNPAPGGETSAVGPWTVTGTVTAVLDVFTSAGKTSNTFTVADATGSIEAFSIPETSYTANVGDNITLTANNSPFQDAPELSKTNFSETTNSTGNPVSPDLITVADLLASGTGGQNGFPYAGPISEGIVTIDNVEFTNGFPSALALSKAYAITDGTGTANLFASSSLSNVKAAATAANAANPGGFGGLYDITGFVSPFFGNPEIFPLSITAVPEPIGMSFLAMTGISLLARRRRSR
jgi:hypothetical protein